MSKSSNFTETATDNPLIQKSPLPYGAPIFDKVKTEHFEPAIDWAVEKLLAEIEEIKNNPAHPTFENTIEALEYAGEDLERINPVFDVLTVCNTNDHIRELEGRFAGKLSSIGSDIAMDDVLFQRIKSVYDIKDSLNLDASQSMLLENTYRSRVHSGALLEGNAADRFKEVKSRLSQLSTQFGQNVLQHKATFEWIVTESDLKGIPERVLKIVKKDTEKAIEMAQKEKDFDRVNALRDRCLVTLSPSVSGAIMAHCENRKLRELIHEAGGRVGTEGTYDNRPIILEIISLRHEQANILGYKNYAEAILEDRMAGTPQVVQSFLEKNLVAYKPEAEKHFNRVKELALASGEVDTFEPYDSSFYGRQLKEQVLDFDDELLRPYFEVNNVIKGLFAHAEKLFNIEIVEREGKYPAYRDDAKVFEVFDKDTGDICALFYADYFDEGTVKSGGAWAMGFRVFGQDKKGNTTIPIVTNSCNFQKPTEGNPSLLSLRDIETMYHEFGHGLHGILSNGGPYSSLNGTRVKRDFVELPSQIQENWVTQPEVIKSYAKHHETGEVIPDEYIQKIQEMATYGKASAGLGQTKYGMLDMFFHTTDPSELSSVEAVEDVLHEKTSFWDDRSGLMAPSFGHLFAGGYASAYYGYKWAEVLDADAFEAFKEKGLYDSEIAGKLKELYAQGGNKDPMDLYKEFRGRTPDPDALFRREGVDIPEQQTAVSSAPVSKPS